VFAFRQVVTERVGTIILSALVTHTAWHWMLDRAEVVRQFPLAWPVVDSAGLASTLRLAMLVVAAAGVVWLIFGVLYPAAGRRIGMKAVTGADDRAQDAGLQKPHLGAHS
jgi:hypothetical protein